MRSQVFREAFFPATCTTDKVWTGPTPQLNAYNIPYSRMGCGGGARAIDTLLFTFRNESLNRTEPPP